MREASDRVGGTGKNVYAVCDRGCVCISGAERRVHGRLFVVGRLGKIVREAGSDRVGGTGKNVYAVCDRGCVCISGAERRVHGRLFVVGRLGKIVREAGGMIVSSRRPFCLSFA